MDSSKFRPVSFSQTTIKELMIPSYANFGGKVHGGIILSLMDKVAYACASKHAANYCVTVAVDNVEFRAPVDVGELLSLKASINYTGRTSLIVGIKVESENVMTGEVTHTNTSYFTMVAKGQDDRPAEVPGLILETREDVRRFLESLKRKDLKKAYTRELNNQKTRLTVEAEMPVLEKERCIVAYNPNNNK